MCRDSAGPGPTLPAGVAQHTYSDRNSNQVRFEWPPAGLTDKRALCLALQGQKGQRPGSAAPPSPSYPISCLSCPALPCAQEPRFLPPWALSMVTVAGFPAEGGNTSWSDKISSLGRFSSEWQCLGQEAPIPICAKLSHGLTPPRLVSPALSHICPSPTSPVPAPPPPHLPSSPHLSTPTRFPLLVLPGCLPTPASSHLPASHSPVVMSKFFKHLLDNQPGVGGRGSVDKNSSQLPRGVDISPKTSCDCPTRSRSQCRP